MPSADEPSSRSTTSGSTRSELAYVKAQYNELASELADFQASSCELETELEKEVEAAEKRERILKDKVEKLKFELDDWKTKFKHSKTEGENARAQLEKEITVLRDANRNLNLKLRNTEVANDDFERQARHTTSSLEDLEFKFNMSIERGVILEEEIRIGDQERENLRIANQRLRDELNDSKIETEIIQDKLRNGGRRRRPTPLSRSPSTPYTPEIFDRSPGTSTVSSPLFTTPPAKMSLTLTSATATPPSPPMSETSTSMRKSLNATSGFPLQKASASESFGSRSLFGARPPQRFSTHSRATSFAYSNARPNSSVTSRPSLPKQNNNNTTTPANRPSGIPKSGSLYQIRGLIGKMQLLEERVQSARSKLPPPSETASRASSRSGSMIGDSPIATMRRDTRKRLSGSSFSSSVREGDGSTSYVASSRPSYGTRTQGDSRPSSRTSFSSSFSHSTHPSVTPSNRPESRQSRTKTPLGHYSTNPTTESRRPRSSLSNPAGQSTPINSMAFIDEDESLAQQMSARAKISEARPSRLPSFSTPTGLKKRSASGISGIPAPRSLRRENTMGPPNPKLKASDLGETF
ncbi:NUDE protein [Aspergillus californicus]